jgi:hypothetical protein
MSVLPVVDNHYRTDKCQIGLTLGCMRVHDHVLAYSNTPQSMMMVLSLPPPLLSPSGGNGTVMEHASEEHSLFRALGSPFQFTCTISQVLKRPVISSLVEGWSSPKGHVRIIHQCLHVVRFLPSDGQVLVIMTVFSIDTDQEGSRSLSLTEVPSVLAVARHLSSTTLVDN